MSTTPTNPQGASRKPPPMVAARSAGRKLEGSRMMNGKAVIPLVAGLCIGGFALKMVFDTVKKAKGAQTAMTQVWTANMDIQLGSRVTEQMIKPVSFPTAAVPPGAFTKKEKLVGRVLRFDTVNGIPVVEGMLHPEGTPAGLVVKEGFRAVAVKIDDSSGVDNHLWPGCKVDVIGYFNIRRGGRNETVARAIIDNVEVAAVGQRLSTIEATDPADKGKKAQPARAVTLFVKPDQVPILHLAEQRGKIKLAMRNSTEGLGEETPQVAVNERAVTGEKDEVEESETEDGEKKPGLGEMFAGLFGKKPAQDPAEKALEAAPQPAQLPPVATAGWVTRVYRGNHVEEIQWKDRSSRERFVPAPAQNTPEKNDTSQVQKNPESIDDSSGGPKKNDAPEQPAPEGAPEESSE